MKNVIISSIVIAALLVSWMFFLFYAENECQQMIHSIEHDIIPSIESEQWKDAKDYLKKTNEKWHHFRKLGLYFFHTETINTIDYNLARALEYANAEDISNTAGELNSIAEQLSFLTENEKLSLQNIF